MAWLVSSPVRYISLCRGRLLVGLLLVTWTAAGVVALVPMLLWSSRHDDLNPPCSFFGLLKADYQRLMVSLGFAQVARRHSRAITAHDVGLRMKEGHTWRYTKTMLAVVGLYIVCWTPAGLLIMLNLAGCLSGYTVEEKGSLLLYACIPAFGNSLVNPALYALKIPAVRRRFRAVFCRPCMAAHPVTLTDPTCTLIASLHHRPFRPMLFTINVIVSSTCGHVLAAPPHRTT
ncbi:hypothetical protein C0Q70_19697 [Pomacea canaliculata]|uniref:G-protein coupled receptors family 1 profile domain-containing protein n=1 Tax=Pomacea canaliculata TaxID=400727 RepID=A0A2T7NDJ1_POMCA|nr:hypothetical protein C0Q70_19697 [Pomacea canaliculata]